jgi:phosphoglycolate phosphatase
MNRVTLLDLDGCVVDSSEPILGSLNGALVAAGLEPITAAGLNRVVGPPLVESVPSLLAERGVADPDPTAVIAAYRQRYRTASVELARAYPGMDAAIDALAQLGRIGVVTSKPLVFARPILAELGLLDRFEVVEGPSTDGHEPKRVTLERALQRLNVAGGPDVVMVGDRSHDIAAGRTHGMGTVGVTWGFGSASELTAAGADALVHAPEDLPKTIAGLTADPPSSGGGTRRGR